MLTESCSQEAIRINEMARLDRIKLLNFYSIKDVATKQREKAEDSAQVLSAWRFPRALR